MIVDIKLLPCPCCGKKDQIIVEDGWKHGKCDRCGFACSIPQKAVTTPVRRRI